jgi:hypothetical protein
MWGFQTSMKHGLAIEERSWSEYRKLETVINALVWALFGGEFSPLGDPKKSSGTHTKDFCERKASNLWDFQGTNS